ncbi:HEC/Ndc80p family-domain-containing protein [Zychaea mexicana]|uniref:HEC/Ndc80p family-domain-containing protein n=1 Tax=Zychaea mexicana TaxID=64656 RepID=UPI0022FEEE53|nr:HEC/Ndc80p family-domain-containing protein [Zychaea mexicana]KAI9491323.1 HEC/Ndc80p family-domain-containing protein [Zychaea mexicana]
MDTRRLTTGGSTRGVRGGLKRTQPPSTSGLAKMARVSAQQQQQQQQSQRRLQSLGPRRAIQVDPRASEPHHPPLRKPSTLFERSQQSTVTSSSGRASTFNRPSFVATASERPAPPRSNIDTRPIRDLEWQRGAIRSIVRYLTENGYGPITAPALRHLENRTFQQVFKFLHLHVVPNFVYPERFQDVFIDIMKSLRYPRADTLSARALFSVAAPHSYPSFLAVLSWMVDMCNDFDAIQNHYATREIEEEEEDPSQDLNILFFHYSVATYNAFLSGADSYEDYDEKVLHLLDNIKNKYTENAQKIADRKASLEDKLAQLKERPDLKQKCLERRERMERDMTKFEGYNTEMRKKVAKYTETIAKTEREVKELEAQLQQANNQKAEMEEKLKSYNISLEEITQLSDKQTQLERECVSAQSLAQQLVKKQSIAENELSQRIAKLASITTEYNAKIAELGIRSTDDGTHLHLEIDAGASNPQHMFSADLKRVILPHLEKLKEQYEELFNKETDRVNEARDKLSKLHQHVTEQQARVTKMKKDLNRAKEIHESERQRFFRDVEKTNAELAQKEQSVKNIRRETKEELYMHEKREQELKLTVADAKAKAETREQQMIAHAVEEVAKVQAAREEVETLAEQLDEQLDI